MKEKNYKYIIIIIIIYKTNPGQIKIKLSLHTHSIRGSKTWDWHNKNCPKNSLVCAIQACEDLDGDSCLKIQDPLQFSTIGEI